MPKKTQYLVNADMSQRRYLGFYTAFLFEGDTDTGMNFLLNADDVTLPVMNRRFRMVIGDVVKCDDCAGYSHKAKIIRLVHIL